MTERPTSTIKSIQICLVLSLLAISVNLFLPISIIGETQILLGSAFAFLALLILPVSLSLIVAISAFLSVIVAGQYWSVSILFLLEFTVIVIALQRNIFLLMASLLYWVAIGVPVLWLINAFSTSELMEGNTIITLQTAFNGLFNAALAATIYTFIPHSWLRRKILQQRRLASNIFAICASTLVVPLLVTSFVFISQYSSQSEASKVDNLRSKSLIIGQLTSNFLAKHQTIVEQLAQVISSVQSTELIERLLIEAQAKTPTFFNLTLVNKDGDLGFFAPEKYNQQIARLPLNIRNVRDRKYFLDARNNLSTTMSSAILSKGVVVAPMVSIAAPLINKNNSQIADFQGIVFGALNLSGLDNMLAQINTLSQGLVVAVTDQKNNLVFSTKPNALKVLSPFVHSIVKSTLLKNLSILRINEKDFVYHKTTTPYGWQVYVFEDADILSQNIRDQFVWVGFGLFVVLSVFLLLAYKLSTRITAPLIALLQNEDEIAPNVIESDDMSKEFSDMAKKLKRSSYLMKNYENRLRLQVEEKTEKLEQLNLMLAAQAREDSLTGLLNRSGFNELALNAIKTSYRLKQPFCLAILDLDLFKVINDTYGHPFGDTCLVEFSKLLQRHCKRETDIIGRYGGEEFIIYISGTDISSQHNIISRIHEHTRAIQITDPNTKKRVNFTVSIGVCTVLSSVNLELSELIKIADDELYNCKRNGRDQVSISELGER